MRIEYIRDTDFIGITDSMTCSNCNTYQYLLLTIHDNHECPLKVILACTHCKTEEIIVYEGIFTP